MGESKSYILTNLEEKIKFLNSVIYDYQVIKNPGLSTSKLHEIRRQFHLGSYRDALRKMIEEEIRENLRNREYHDLCKFMMDNGFETDIILIPDEALRIKYLKRMENQTSKATVLASISDDELKKEYLCGFKKEEDRLIVLCSLRSDEEKMKYFDKITDYHKQADLIASLDSDDLKLEAIASGKVRPYMIGNILATLKNDSKKEELIDLVPSDTSRLKVILTIEDDETKKRLYEEKIQSQSFKDKKKVSLILSFSIDEQLRHFGEFNDGIKVAILQNCDFDTQLKLMPLIEAEEMKKVVFGRIPPDFLLKYMAFNYGNTTNYWVRTDSEEREANVPRDDREKMVSEIVEFSSIPADNKVALVKAYVKNKEKVRELLKFIPHDVVLSSYFDLKENSVNLGMLDEISQSYDIESVQDVLLNVDRNFDFDDPTNIALIERVKQMQYPKLSLDKVSYNDYRKWLEITDNTDIIISANNINIGGLNLSLEELKELSLNSEYIITDKNITREAARYYKVAEFSRKTFPQGEDEKFDSIRNEIESHFMLGWMGPILIKSNQTMMNAGFSEEEIKKYGERLVESLYNTGIESTLLYTLSLDAEAVDLLHKWDSTHSILKNDLNAISTEMTSSGIKRAAEIALEEGYVSEDFAIGHVLDYLSTKHIPVAGLEYSKKITLELMQRQGISLEDVKNLNPGSFSDVFAIGDFVLKIGLTREQKTVPKHDRILPSLLRFEVEEEGNAVSSFVEVQPRVKAWNDFEDEFSYDERLMYRVYSELRDSQIIWGDAAKRNLGFLDKDIVVPEGLFSKLKKELEMTEGITVYHEDNQNFDFHRTSETPYMYVVDADFLYQIDETKELPELYIPSVISGNYETVYRQIREERKQAQSKQRKKEIQKLRKNIDGIFDEV